MSKLKKLEIVNLTIKTISLMDKDGNLHNIPSSGECKVWINRTPLKVDGTFNTGTFKLNKSKLEEVKGLPERKDGIIYIVSSLVYDALGFCRDDIFTVDELSKQKSKVLFAKALSRKVSKEKNIRKKRVNDLLSELKTDIESDLDIILEIKSILNSGI